MEEKSRQSKDTIIIGLAIFAMFFGAGSLLFPPYLGMTSGTSWTIGFICFYIVDLVLAFVTVIALIRGTGKMSGITGIIGKIPSTIINTAVLVCIGPLFIVPRSSATTYEMAIIPVLPNFNPVVFSIIFFGIAWVMAVRRSKLVDLIGKYLTPIMVVTLVILIFVGVTNPVGTVVAPATDSVIRDGILAGYQAMDVLGALTVAIVVIGTVSERGYTEKNVQVSIAAKACIVAGTLLFLIYCGLTYLGASASGVYDITTMNQAGLLVAITTQLLGESGMALLGVIVAAASLTTAIGVSSAVATYFEGLSGQKLSYNTCITIIMIFSTVVSNFGLSAIISLAVPVLSVVYPTVITLIILSFLRGKIYNVNAYKGAALVSFIISICTVASSYGAPITFIQKLPLVAYGFEWLIPTVIGGAIGSLIKKNSEIPANADEGY
ncbi:branched-chain amino acid transport system II carrier protein [Chakrabartyella piscis]|uniref:branched-chain amino acid transport system II carrier protein n=1 Tax=Chakrabartyella piscis TaxID=2918914 RepID=UPI0029589B7B|nr:branched-chain amino acid transport system II carrier protein [Chakrabartyella piscis]